MSNILVIEDDPAVLYSIVDLLEAENFQVTTAIDGDIALEIIKCKKIDLVLCDLLLPRVNGYEVLSALRKNTDTSNVPFIVLTGKGRREDIRLGMEVGVSEYIVKPFANQELIKSIRSKLEAKKFLEKCYQADCKQTNLVQNIGQQNLLPDNTKQSLAGDRTAVNKFNQIVQRYVESKVKANSPGNSKITSIAVCCLSLNNFTELSRSLSKEHYDFIIQTIIQRLYNAIGDRAKIMCLSNGDFTLIFPYVKHLNRAIELVTIAQSSLLEPLITEDITFSFTPYVGISFYPAYSEDIENLIDHAQKALQQAKQNSDDCYEIYYPNIQPALEFRSITLHDNLWNSLKNNELSVHYQPQVDLISGKVVGCEALLRWTHPRLGNIPPNKFIPVAEDSGFIESIEQWFMHTVFRQLAKWHRQGHEGLKLAINISGSQFNRHNFIDTITSALNQVALEPKFLTIEIIEDILLYDLKNSIEKLSELKSLGINIAIDNFGTGYSSLSYLEQFPFNVLKVDISYLHSLFGIRDSQIALQYIVKVAQRLNARVIVEKVETHEQLNFLRQNQFKIAQGYFVSAPLATNKFESLLQNMPHHLSILFSFPPL